jgi:hypothetical protein
MILIWTIPFPVSILQQNPFFPYNKTVWKWGRDEREKLLLMSIKLPMYLFMCIGNFMDMSIRKSFLIDFFMWSNLLHFSVFLLPHPYNWHKKV